MSGLQATPGPWRVAPYGTAGRESTVQIVNGTSQICGPANKPDANLIAAAPELYEALAEAQRYGRLPHGINERAIAALAKARGEPS